DVLGAHPARPVVHHLLEAPLAQGDQLGDDAEVLLGHVDRDALDGLVHAAADRPRDDLWLADGQLETLAPHGLDEDRELELAAALYLPGVGPLRLLHAQRDVADQLLLQPRLELARRQLRSILSGER